MNELVILALAQSGTPRALDLDALTTTGTERHSHKTRPTRNSKHNQTENKQSQTLRLKPIPTQKPTTTLPTLPLAVLRAVLHLNIEGTTTDYATGHIGPKGPYSFIVPLGIAVAVQKAHVAQNLNHTHSYKEGGKDIVIDVPLTIAIKTLNHAPEEGHPRQASLQTRDRVHFIHTASIYQQLQVSGDEIKAAWTNSGFTVESGHFQAQLASVDGLTANLGTTKPFYHVNASHDKTKAYGTAYPRTINVLISMGAEKVISRKQRTNSQPKTHQAPPQPDTRVNPLYAPPPTMVPAYTPVYALTFDSTLGYPGEGPPATIVSLNINGAKHKLAGVLDRLARARVDVLLLQEIHYYNDNWHREPLRALCLAKRWDLFLSPPGPNDTGGGTAVLVYQDSQSVKPIAGTLRTALDGRLASVQVNINDIKTEITSVYLNAQAAPRRNQIKKIKDDRLIKRESIVGGDFNCVTSSNLDVAHYNNQTVYANTGGREWAALTAHLGLVDTHRQFHGNKRGGYTRITPTVATRIDRLYASKYNTHWRWTHVAPDDTLLPINTTDHLPLVAKVETAPPRPPSEHEMKIDVSLYEENWVRGLVTKTWISLEAERPQDQFGAGEAYSHAKQGVAKGSG
jgi:exonuclease III